MKQFKLIISRRGSDFSYQVCSFKIFLKVCVDRMSGDSIVICFYIQNILE